MRTFSRVIRLGIQNFTRNGWLSFVATLMMTITLLTLSTYVLLSLLIRVTTVQLQSRVDFRIDFFETASDAEIGQLQTELANRSDVKKITYISKEAALENLGELSVELQKIAQEGPNPLPRGLAIKPADPQDLEGILTFLERPQFSELIEANTYTDSQKAIERLLRLTALVRNAGIGLSIVFGLASMIVILYTIVLAIYSRREELDIMRLVGASNSFVRLPFLVEGVIYGVLGTIASTAILFFAVNQLGTTLTDYLERQTDVQGLFFGNLPFIIFVQLSVGIFIGTVSNWLGTRRFLKI